MSHSAAQANDIIDKIIKFHAQNLFWMTSLKIATKTLGLSNCILESVFQFREDL